MQSCRYRQTDIQRDRKTDRQTDRQLKSARQRKGLPEPEPSAVLFNFLFQVVPISFIMLKNLKTFVCAKFLFDFISEKIFSLQLDHLSPTEYTNDFIYPFCFPFASFLLPFSLIFSRIQNLESHFKMRPHISVRTSVRPSVGLSVDRWLPK